MLEDPWEYQKHLTETYLNCIDEFDRRYSKYLLDLGFVRTGRITQTTRKEQDWIGDRVRYTFALKHPKLEYLIGDIRFYFIAGIESLNVYTKYPDMVDILKTDWNIDEYLKSYTCFSWLAGIGTYKLYQDYKDICDKISWRHVESIKREDLVSKFPESWVRDLIERAGKNKIQIEG